MEYKGHEIHEPSGFREVTVFGPYFPHGGKMFPSVDAAKRAIDEQIAAKDRR